MASSHQNMTDLFNTRVTHVEKVMRPGHGSCNPFDHAGVRATTADGRQFLIHTGPNYGIEGRERAGITGPQPWNPNDTVVTDASHMSDKWRVEGARIPVTEHKTIGDLVQGGGEQYKLFSNNCRHSANTNYDGGNSCNMM